MPGAGASNYPYRADSASGAINTIEYAHHEIHGGSTFLCHYDSDVSDTDHRSAITFKTGNTTKWCHMVVYIAASDAADAYIYENVLIEGGAAGQPTALTVYNRDRNSGSTSTVISSHSTPVTGGMSGWTEALLQDGNVGDNANWAVTTEIELEHMPIGVGESKQSSLGGSSRATQEIILKQNAVYMVMVQSRNANDNTHHIHLDWYEHTSKGF